jgi:signal transduction histidine kinase
VDSGVELTLTADELPVCEGDADRLGQVLDNLISNAIKFTPRGGRVDVAVLRRGEQALIEVSDTGPGIPAQEQEHLFERFYRASHAKEQEKQGVGLGLAITKVIVEAHEGRIWLGSDPGEGTTFHVELPLRKPEDGPIG